MLTLEQKLRSLLQLSWTVRVSENLDDGGYVARVAELPSVIATGETPDELERDLWSALEAVLRGYLHFGDEVPLPPGLDRLPWDPNAVVARETSQATVVPRGDGWAPPPTLISSSGSIARAELIPS